MKKYLVYSEEDFNGTFEIIAKNIEDARQKVNDLIDIHEKKELK